MIAKNDVAKLNYILHPQHLIQCSDISSFPNDFIEETKLHKLSW